MHPEIIHLDNDKNNPPRINLWHSDVTWRPEPSLGSVLRAIEAPEVGGDTLFANMEAAYDKLDDATKDAIYGLTAVHDNEIFITGMHARGATEADALLAQLYASASDPDVQCRFRWSE